MEAGEAHEEEVEAEVRVGVRSRSPEAGIAVGTGRSRVEDPVRKKSLESVPRKEKGHVQGARIRRDPGREAEIEKSPKSIDLVLEIGIGRSIINAIVTGPARQKATRTN